MGISKMKAALFCIFALFVINAHASPWGTSRLYYSRLSARAAPAVARDFTTRMFERMLNRELLRADDASAFVGPFPSNTAILEEANEEPMQEANVEVEAENRYWGMAQISE